MSTRLVYAYAQVVAHRHWYVGDSPTASYLLWTDSDWMSSCGLRDVRSCVTQIGHYWNPIDSAWTRLRPPHCVCHRAPCSPGSSACTVLAIALADESQGDTTGRPWTRDISGAWSSLVGSDYLFRSPYLFSSWKWDLGWPLNFMALSKATRQHGHSGIRKEVNGRFM